MNLKLIFLHFDPPSSMVYLCCMVKTNSDYNAEKGAFFFLTAAGEDAPCTMAEGSSNLES